MPQDDDVLPSDTESAEKTQSKSRGSSDRRHPHVSTICWSRTFMILLTASFIMCIIGTIFLLFLFGTCCYGSPEPRASSIRSVNSYTVPASFPTSIFSNYYYGASPGRQPQPKIHDQVLGITYPLELTDPATIPEETFDPIFFPTPIGNYTNGTAIISAAKSQISQIIASTASNCTKCQQVLAVAQSVAQRVPTQVPDLLVDLCQTTKFQSNTSCVENYAAHSYGAVLTQVLALGNMSGLDGQYMCTYLSSTFCPRPFTIPSNTSRYFGPKPKNVSSPGASGKRVKVLHLSDLHLDARFAVGQEANCTAGLCCRFPRGSNDTKEPTSPATTYGNFKCDSPYYLAAAALRSIGPLTGTTTGDCKDSLTDHFAWTIYTGDLVSHDPPNELSRNYTTYTEWATYHMMKSFIAGGPVFAALGNHDSDPNAIDAPHKLPGNLGQQQSWNYQHVAALWRHNNWISDAAAAQARLHYGAYSITHPKFRKLRIITLNTDFWYRSNYLNYVNTTNPDVSGNLKFLAEELQHAENNKERVWIVGHVLTGWDGTNPLPNPTDLFYQIVDRYSPHVIANIFFGHTHEDQFMIYYSDNGTVRDAAHAQTVGWICPSLTPLNNLNTGFRMYEVDTGDFSVYNAYTYFSDVNSFITLDANRTGPVFQLEYSTREAYPIDWPADAPLNATYWHRVTEAMEKNHTMVSRFNTYQGKSSIFSPNCTSDACAAAKICYMRSGSVALGQQCPQGFGSVQSKYTGTNF